MWRHAQASAGDPSAAPPAEGGHHDKAELDELQVTGRTGHIEVACRVTHIRRQYTSATEAYKCVQVLVAQRFLERSLVASVQRQSHI